MRAIGQFTPANAGESEVYGFDFAKDLPEGDSISTVTFGIAVVSGTDPDPASHLTGQPSVSGTQTLQRVQDLIAGVIYTLEATVVTTMGNTLVLWAPIICQPFSPRF